MDGAHTRRRNLRQRIKKRWRNLRRWWREHRWARNLLEGLAALVSWFAVTISLYALLHMAVSLLATLPFPTDTWKVLRNLLSESPSFLAAFVTALLGFAAQQWRSWREERRREIFGELEHLNQALEGRDFADALRLYHSFRRRCQGIWKGLGAEERIGDAWENAPPPLQIWAELSENRREPALEWEILEALVWGWRIDPEHREVAKGFLPKIIPHNQLGTLVTLLEKNPAWRTILRSDLLGEWLSELPESPEADTLKMWRDAPPHLPSPWEGVLRPPEDKGFADWLESWGFSFNPFGPEHTELDPELAEYGVWPAALEGVRGHRPAIVFAHPGLGRTAGARLLAHACSEAATPETGAFPVFVEADNWPQTPQGWLEAIGRAVAKGLLRACVQDPYALFEHSGGPAVAQLLAFCFGTGESLAALLHRIGMDGEAHAYILHEVGRFSTGGQSPDQAMLEDLLQRARTAGFMCTYAILDIPLPSPSEMASAGLSISTLLGLVIPLSSRRVFLKIFLPEALRPSPGWLWPMEPLSLRWSEKELREAIKKRLQTASDGNVKTLAGICSHYPHPETWLVQSANGSPRQLVRLGNQLLKEAYQKSQAPGS